MYKSQKMMCMSLAKVLAYVILEGGEGIQHSPYNTTWVYKILSNYSFGLQNTNFMECYTST